jgi:hypothetical protein
MGKIYEGETKLNILQVCDKLRNEITAEQANALGKWYDPTDEESTAKSKFAHMVLDGYRNMPNTTEHDMMVKKLAKHLMEKYMKSSATMENEETAFRLLVDSILNKVTE